MDKVSIIIPAYNAEKYLRRCLDSAINQTYHNIEVICIDDCSSDTTYEILREYQVKYKEKFLIIRHNKNKGVSASRNEGIGAATGKYLVFCDADDWYEINAIEKMYIKIKETGADFLFSNYYLNKNNHQLKRNIIVSYTNNPICKKEIVQYMDISSWAKMIKASLIRENELYYPLDLRRCEEYTVIPVAAYLAKKVVFLEEYTYNYFQNQNSVSNEKEKNLDFFEEAFTRYLKYIDKEMYQEELLHRAMEHLLYGKTLCMLKAGYSSNEVKKWIKYFEQTYGEVNKRILLQFGISRKVFFSFVKYRFIVGLKVLVKIHEMITG